MQRAPQRRAWPRWSCRTRFDPALDRPSRGWPQAHAGLGRTCTGALGWQAVPWQPCSQHCLRCRLRLCLLLLKLVRTLLMLLLLSPQGHALLC